MCKIYVVSKDGALNMVHAHTNRIPICTEMLLKQCNFLTDCSPSANAIVRSIFLPCFGRVELSNVYVSWHCRCLYAAYVVESAACSGV